MRSLLVALCAALVPLQLGAQQGRAPRAELEARVFRAIVQRSAQELQLDSVRSAQLAEVLRTSAESRREIARSAMQTRRQLLAAVQDASTPDAEIALLLDRITDLRRRELDVWTEEQAALAHILTPRQRAELIGLRERFARRLMDTRQGRRSPGGRPPF